MGVFKTALKITLKNLPMVFMYITIFTAVMIVFQSVNISDNYTEFSAEKVKVAVVNRDADGEIAAAIDKYVADNHIRVEVIDEPKALEDALFFRSAEFIITIPAGYSASFLTGGMSLSESSLPDSADRVYVSMQVEQYIKALRAYLKNVPGATVAAAQQSAALALKSQAGVEVFNPMPVDLSRLNVSFSWMTYVLICIICFSLSPLMMALNKSGVSARTLISPVRRSSINFQKFGAFMLLAVAIYFLLLAVTAIICRETFFTIYGLVCAISMFCLTVTCVSIAFLFGSFIKSDAGLSAAINITAIGMSFLVGAFVPQALLSTGLLIVARFLPAYWYVVSINQVTAMPVITASGIWQIVGNLSILIGFAVLFFLIAAVVLRHAKEGNE